MELKSYIRKPHFYETDQMGVIHHANYIRWFEEARVDMMEQMGYGYDKAVAAGIDIAVLSVQCDYRAMVRFGDTVRIDCRILSVDKMRMKVGYEVRDYKSGELRTTGETGHCFFSRARQRPVAVDKALPELYELVLAMCE